MLQKRGFQGASAPPQPGSSLRTRLTILVFVTVLTGVGLGLLVDYHYEKTIHMTGVFTSLEQQADTLALVRPRFSDVSEFSDFAQRFCDLTDKHLSPGHHVLLLDPSGALVKTTFQHGHNEFREALSRSDEALQVVTANGHRLAGVRRVQDDSTTLIVAQYLDYVDAILVRQLLRRSITGGIIAVVLTVLMLVLVNQWVLRPVARLAATAKHWSLRDFAARVPSTGASELRGLEHELNSMAAELQTVETRREQALQRARRIQSNLLPPSLPSAQGLTLSAVYRPAEPVAGDLYDVFALPDGSLAVAIIDVAGHGLSAALLTGVVKMSLRRRLIEQPDPAQALGQVNHDLVDYATQEEFVTVCVGIWDPVSRTWTYCSAGHPAGLLVRDNQVTPLDTTGPLLAVFAEETWTNTTVRLDDADRMLLYTDGVTEAGGPDKPLGETGLMRLLAESGHLTLDEQVSRIADEAVTRCSVAGCDDITLVAFEVERERLV